MLASRMMTLRTTAPLISAKSGSEVELISWKSPSKVPLKPVMVSSMENPCTAL